jgi:hypothetical protein
MATQRASMDATTGAFSAAQDKERVSADELATRKSLLLRNTKIESLWGLYFVFYGIKSAKMRTIRLNTIS